MTFDAAEQSPRYPELMAYTPNTSGQNGGMVVLLVFIAIFTLFCVGMTFFFLIGGPIALCPAVMALLGVYAFWRMLAGMMKFNAAPLERVLGVIRDETVETTVETVTDKDPLHANRTRTRRLSRSYNYVLLELKNGERQSYAVAKDLARLVVKGDIGVAYLKGGVLLEFKLVRPA